MAVLPPDRKALARARGTRAGAEHRTGVTAAVHHAAPGRRAVAMSAHQPSRLSPSEARPQPRGGPLLPCRVGEFASTRELDRVTRDVVDQPRLAGGTLEDDVPNLSSNVRSYKRSLPTRRRRLHPHACSRLGGPADAGRGFRSDFSKH
jgi:hypothetical protein